MWILSLLLVGQIIFIVHSLVSRMDLKNPPLAEGFPLGSVNTSNMNEEEILAHEAQILESLKMPPSKVTPPPTSNSPEYQERGFIDDPEIEEMVEMGRLQRSDGDTSAALEIFRQANARIPDNPRILSEIASVYNAMGLTSKASVYWQQIWQLGPEIAGDYYTISDLHLKGDAATPKKSETKLYVSQAFTKRHPETIDGEQVTVRVSIKAAEGAVIDVTKLHIDFPFFDLVDNRTVAPTMADTPIESWVTPPVDWQSQNEEILDMVYFFPKTSEEEISRIGQREYYGFVVKLYYDNELQDIYSYPRTLLDQISRERNSNTPNLDDSLFPRD
jgi:tetratricopeptide (TPR) repeat protein